MFIMYKKNVKTCKSRLEKQILDICWRYRRNYQWSCSICTCSQYLCVCVATCKSKEECSAYL